MSAGERGASSSSCTSVNTVCSDGGRPLSLSSSTSSVSLQDASHSSSSSSSSSSLPYGAVPAYNASLSSSTPKRNGSDISLDLTPLVMPHSAAAPSAGGGLPKMATAASSAHYGHITNPVAAMSAGATPRQLSRLERVILEIVETEQTYVRDLKSIVEVSDDGDDVEKNVDLIITPKHSGPTQCVADAGSGNTLTCNMHMQI